MQKQYPIKDYLSNRAAYAPAFNSTSERVAYLSNVDSNTTQIHVYSRESGRDEYVSAYDDNVGFVYFSPVSDTLVFSRDVGGNENHQIYLHDFTNGEPERISRDTKARYQFGGWSRSGTSILLSSNERNGTDNDVFLYDIAAKTYSTLYDGGGSVFPNGFSPSGRYAVLYKMTSLVNNDLLLVDREDGNSTILLTEHEGNVRYSMAGWLEDESGFFVISDRDGDFLDLYFFDRKAGTIEPVMQYGWDIEGVALSRDNAHMIVSTNEDGYTKNYFYSLQGHGLTEVNTPALPDSRLEEFVYAKDTGSIAFTRSSFDSGFNVWIYDIKAASAAPITHMPQAVPGDTMVRPELIRYDSFDGLSVPAFLYVPQGEGPFPTLVSIHGGPEGQYIPGFMPLTQYYVSRGYAVIAPNVRGSTGYGKAYTSLDDVRKRLDSVEDLRGLHTWATNDSRIDTDRIALMGGSYGGYMVLAGLAFQPELWSAGVDTVGIANFVTFLQNTSPYRRKLREAEYGSLENDREFLESVSPINKVDDITAPLIIIHGANDPRVPLDEAQQIYDKLRARGIESEFYVYPDEGHGIVKIKNRLDVYPKIARFLDKNLK